MLDASVAAFVQQGVSILVASRDASNLPHVSRGTGCSVLDDKHLVVYVPTTRSTALLDAIRDSSAIAVVFSEPATHRTIQIKGTDAASVATPADAAMLNRYADDFLGVLGSLGYNAAMADSLVRMQPGEVTGVAFTATAIFNQTPGPRAGEPLQPAP